MTAFIQATECWLPSQDRSHLAFGGGLYAPASRLGAISPDMCASPGVVHLTNWWRWPTA